MSGKPPAPGWVKLHRAMFDDLPRPYCEGLAWLWLHAFANHAQGAAMVANGRRIEIPRGGLAKGRAALAASWGWTEKRTRGFLARLEAAGLIEIQANGRQGNLLIVRDYERWQGKAGGDGRAK